MGQPINLPIANGSYESESTFIADLVSINLYPNLPQNQGFSQETSLGTPGIKQLDTTGIIKQINRGSHVKNGIAYAVNGDTLYREDRAIDGFGVETFSNTALGTITGEGRVSMADNGIQLLILVPGGDGFVFNEDAGTPFEQITDLDFPANGNPQSVVFISGFFIFNTDEKKLIASAINNGLSYNALDFASAESDPDAIEGIIVSKNILYVPGGETTEAFQPDPNASTGFPLTRIEGYVFDKGLFAPFSLVKTSGSFMMIGGGTNESPAIWQFTGNGFSKVSTTAIDNILQRLTDTEISESFAMNYAQKGAYFTLFTFGDNTFGYDAITQRWHERRSFIDEEKKRYRVNSMITAYGRILVFDSIDGRMGELDVDTLTEYDEEIRRTLSTANFGNSGESMRVSSLELTMQSGVGNTARPDPKVSMDFSVDGGNSFSLEREASIGKIGEYTRRQIWRKLGRMPRSVMFRFHISDPVKVVIISAVANIA